MEIQDDPIFRDRQLLRPGLALPKTGRTLVVRAGIVRFLRRRRKGATT